MGYPFGNEDQDFWRKKFCFKFKSVDTSFDKWPSMEGLLFRLQLFTKGEGMGEACLF